MDDLIKRLREASSTEIQVAGDLMGWGDLMREAADRIEALRALLDDTQHAEHACSVVSCRTIWRLSGSPRIVSRVMVIVGR